ncbi:hypothetical protein B0H34DRAFT_42020 [Crassisporium funariophilum]|nr:hypothetical protein B0H34DRAFT_42020 [Crassisporium funariophilum]
MQGSSLPPPHPSLPRQPANSYPVNTFASASYQHQQQLVHNLPAYYNSHYVQAYSQQSTSAGNNYSSLEANAGPSVVNSNHWNSSSGPMTETYRPPISNSASMSSWYQSGNNRCSQPGCSFSGSHKSVEIHLMDRHLIYPPGWEKRNKKQDWDADPSLKGKPIPIQGTNVILDSPEVLEAWIAERKKRFPTSARVDDKKRKLEEAAARGQLDIAGNGLRPNKRQKPDNGEHRIAPQRSHTHTQNDAARGGSNGPGKNRGMGRKVDAGWGGRSQRLQGTSKSVAPALVAPVPTVRAIPDSGSSSEDEVEEEPETHSSKISSLIEAPPIPAMMECPQADDPTPPPRANRHDAVERNRAPPQPKNQPRNPFASRPTLLRNLLLPEIRITVSNLSQAIRFLVDNDFLRDVELKPGQASEANMIQVLQQESDATSN